MTAPGAVAEAGPSGDPTQADVVFELRGVTVRFGGVVALDGVSASLHRGEILALIGPNGAGKTTLLNVASGILRPAQGSIVLDGEDVSSAKPWLRARRGLARTFQRVTLLPELTVRDHLVLADLLHGRRLTGLSRAALAGRPPAGASSEAVEQVLDDLELRPLADAAVVGLPLGTARLVDLARALVARPRVLLLDEPASGLAGHERVMLADAIRHTCHDQGIATLLIEHDMEFVTGLCQRVVVLDFGEVIATGAPHAVLRDPVVRAAYLGQGTFGGPGGQVDPEEVDR